MKIYISVFIYFFLKSISFGQISERNAKSSVDKSWEHIQEYIVKKLNNQDISFIKNKVRETKISYIDITEPVIEKLCKKDFENNRIYKEKLNLSKAILLYLEPDIDTFASNIKNIDFLMENIDFIDNKNKEKRDEVLYLTKKRSIMYDEYLKVKNEVDLTIKDVEKDIKFVKIRNPFNRLEEVNSSMKAFYITIKRLIIDNIENLNSEKLQDRIDNLINGEKGSNNEGDIIRFEGSNDEIKQLAYKEFGYIYFLSKAYLIYYNPDIYFFIKNFDKCQKYLKISKIIFENYSKTLPFYKDYDNGKRIQKISNDSLYISDINFINFEKLIIDRKNNHEKTKENIDNFNRIRRIITNKRYNYKLTNTYNVESELTGCYTKNMKEVLSKKDNSRISDEFVSAGLIKINDYISSIEASDENIKQMIYRDFGALFYMIRAYSIYLNRNDVFFNENFVNALIYIELAKITYENYPKTMPKSIDVFNKNILKNENKIYNTYKYNKIDSIAFISLKDSIVNRMNKININKTKEYQKRVEEIISNKKIEDVEKIIPNDSKNKLIYKGVMSNPFDNINNLKKYIKEVNFFYSDTLKHDIIYVDTENEIMTFKDVLDLIPDMEDVDKHVMFMFIKEINKNQFKGLNINGITLNTNEQLEKHIKNITKKTIIQLPKGSLLKIPNLKAISLKKR